MTVPDSILVALFCISMVFVVLVCISLIITIFSAVLRSVFKSNDNTAASEEKIVSEEPISELPVFSSGTLKLKDVDEPTAAMIMAIVSDESGIPLSELCFKSISLVSE